MGPDPVRDRVYRVDRFASWETLDDAIMVGMCAGYQGINTVSTETTSTWWWWWWCEGDRVIMTSFNNRYVVTCIGYMVLFVL